MHRPQTVQYNPNLSAGLGPLPNAFLRDGTPIELRPLGISQKMEIRDLLERLSERSRHYRFASQTPRVSERLLSFLAEIDTRNHVAWGAYLDGQLVGMSRFVRFPHDPGAADIAVTIDDAHHGRGVGSLLLEALAIVAPDCGIERFGFSVMGANRKAIRLLARFGGKFEYSQGMGEGELVVTAFRTGRLSTDQLLRSAKQRPDQVSSMAQILKSTSPAARPVRLT